MCFVRTSCRLKDIFKMFLVGETLENGYFDLDYCANIYSAMYFFSKDWCKEKWSNKC